jgi:hypothetical protein
LNIEIDVSGITKYVILIKIERNKVNINKRRPQDAFIASFSNPKHMPPLSWP